jgi:flagellar hook-length control protein FliK
MMTDPVRQVRQSTLLGPAPVPIPLEALDVTDKPVLESAPSEVVLLQADAGAGANTRTDAVSRAETPRQTPEVHQRVIDQLVKEIKLVKLQDGSDLMVRLQPPELGSLRIHLVSDAQGVTSQIEASNPQVRSLLQAHMPMLMDALSTAGVRLDSVSVTAAMSLGAWSDNAAQQHSQQQTGTPRHRHGAGGLDPAMLSGEPAAAYGLQESAAFSWLA